MTLSSDMNAALDALARELEACRDEILTRWRSCVEGDPQISGSSHMTRAQFYDHIPLLLETFGQKLRDAPYILNSAEALARETEMAHQHSHHRWQQGYSVRSLVREWGHLNGCMTSIFNSIEAPAPVLSQARGLWAEFVNQNISEGVAEYESLLQSEARVRLQDLETALQTMNQMEVARGEMLRAVSHDLRGSLSVVTGASSLLGKREIGEDDRNNILNVLQAGVRSVTQMLSDLMDMSRLEAGQENRLTDDFDAAQILIDLCGNSRMLAENRGLWLRTNGPKSLRVHGDSRKMQRIAQNLLLNALKYTIEGGVTVSWGTLDDDQWYFSVCDTGPGIEGSSAAPLTHKIAKATDDADKIGASAPKSPKKSKSEEPIPKAESAADGLSMPGEGIGLSIVRRLCELLDATLELKPNEQNAGHGSTFRVVFPRSYHKPAEN